MCDLYNAKVVISSSHKPVSFEETAEQEDESQPTILEVESLFRKHGVELLGYTPRVSIATGTSSPFNVWKDFEIIYYLETHPEIEHFAILDDTDDLDFVILRSHLVEIGYYDEAGYFVDGLEESDIPRVGVALSLDNPYRNLIAQEREYRVRRRKPRKE